MLLDQSGHRSTLCTTTAIHASCHPCQQISVLSVAALSLNFLPKSQPACAMATFGEAPAGDAAKGERAAENRRRGGLDYSKLVVMARRFGLASVGLGWHPAAAGRHKQLALAPPAARMDRRSLRTQSARHLAFFRSASNPAVGAAPCRPHPTEHTPKRHAICVEARQMAPSSGLESPPPVCWPS